MVHWFMFSDWCWFAVLLLPWQDCLWLQDLRSTTLCQKQSWNLMEFPLGIRISVDSHWFAEFMYDQTAGSSLDSDLSDLASMRIEVYWKSIEFTSSIIVISQVSQRGAAGTWTAAIHMVFNLVESMDVWFCSAVPRSIIRQLHLRVLLWRAVQRQI